MNVIDLLLSEGDHDDVALIDGKQSYSHGDLRGAVVELAAQLESGPSAVGDRIGIVARNSYFWTVAYLATIYAGRVAVPFPTTTMPDEALGQARWVGVTQFLVERAQLRRFASVFAEVPVVHDGELIGSTASSSGWAPVDVGADADAVLQLTSGTTSAPKAVRVSHGNIAANTESIVGYLGLRRDDRMLVVLPFSYCFGASLLHTHLRVGASVALCHTMTFPETVVEAIGVNRCTGFAGVPSTYQLLLQASTFTRQPLPTLRHLQQAGGRLAPSLIDELVEGQPGAKVYVMYGQTEATSRLSYLPPEEVTRHRGSIGRGIPGVQLRVVDDDDHDVPPGEVGEIVADGPSVTMGYWNDPTATTEKYKGGVLRTGDLATVDDDGYIYIVDRKSDFIKSWGVRISSQEIEAAASELGGVAAAAAVGIPDDAAGEAIVLFIVSREPSLVPADILTALRGRLAKHMVPHDVRFVPELPLNTNGKPLKSRLRELAMAREPSTEHAPVE